MLKILGNYYEKKFSSKRFCFLVKTSFCVGILLIILSVGCSELAGLFVLSGIGLGIMLFPLLLVLVFDSIILGSWILYEMLFGMVKWFVVKVK